MTEDIDAVDENITPEQIAPMILYLASDLAKDVNGRIFGCHGPHIFEYHMVLSPGVELEDGATWTASQIGEKLAEIGELPKAKAPAAAEAGELSIEEQCGQVFDTMPELFMPERAGDWSSTIHFDLTGTGSWTVKVDGGKCTTSKGKPDNADCNIVYQSADILLGAVTGKINSQQAFMAGQISADNMADLMKFAQCFDMKKAAALAKKKAGGESAAVSVEDQCGEVFKRMPTLFMPEKAGEWSSVLHFNIEGTGSWTVSVAGGECTTGKGAPDNANCNITYKSADVLLGTVTGKINAQQAFMQGDIAADNMGDLMKFAQCFDMKRAAAEAKKETGDDEAAAAPAQEGMNRDALGTTIRGPAEFVYPQDAEGYARATNDLNDAYVNGGNRLAPLLFPVRPFTKVIGEAVTNRDLNADLLRLVHGEQEMIFHDVLRPWDLVAPRATLFDIEDKSSGQLLKVKQTLMRDGEVVCETYSGYFIRAKRKPGEKKEPKEATAPVERDYSFSSTFKMDSDQSIRYAEFSLDNNPIHTSEKTAQSAGHPGIICHGLCTMAMTGRELVNHLAGGDPARLKRFKVRFTKIVLPGDELTTRAWLVEENDAVTTYGVETLNQDGDLVIGNALVEIAK
jgi:acyl dehydratase/putative sterol carrier protein